MAGDKKDTQILNPLSVFYLHTALHDISLLRVSKSRQKE